MFAPHQKIAHSQGLAFSSLHSCKNSSRLILKQPGPTFWSKLSTLLASLISSPSKSLKKSNGNPGFILPKGLAHNLLLDNRTMKTGDLLNTTKLIRSQKTGVVLPRQGTFVRDIENLGRKLILANFGSAGEEYLFPNEVFDEA